MARRATLYGAGAGAALLVGEMLYVRAKFRLPPDARGPLAGVEQPTAVSSAAAGRGWLRSADPPPRQLNIVFLGDSLVTGVGCSAEASEARGPVLPRRVAELLAQQLGTSVAWSCVGETGADVSMLRTRMLPMLQSEIQRVTASGEGQRVDAVIVMTGLNDIKECLLFANPRLHPWRFGELSDQMPSDCALMTL
jgi:lysophospholipase L1-like esterase